MPVSVRERVVREMARVTKPTGRVAVVDYGRPPGVLGDVFFRLVKLVEPEHYVEFARSDLPALLRRAGIEPQIDVYKLVRAVRILIGSPFAIST
jgi:ubiquinone/menaquinone biosynthesis C-methylase UbiE